MSIDDSIIQQIVTDAKALLGIADDSKDAVLNYHTRAVVQKVLNYCHREDLPDALVLIIVEMVVRQYTAWNADAAEAEGGGGGVESGGIAGVVGSITRGDFSISYDNSTEAIDAATAAQAVKASAWKLPTDDILLDYRGQLKTFRKLVVV